MNNVDDFEIEEWRSRLRFLADIVFATSMTIMILNIEIPKMGLIDDPKEFARFMLDQLAGMGAFAISFVVVAIYWMKHLEHFGVILKVNTTFIWFQLFFLLSIMLVPFWNTYVTQFPDNEAIKVFFSLNMILIGVFSFLSLNYAGNPDHRLIHSSVSDEAIKTAKLQALSEPAIAAVAAGVVFIKPVLWDVVFVMIPVAFALRKRLVKVKYFKFLGPKTDH